MEEARFLKELGEQIDKLSFIATALSDDLGHNPELPAEEYESSKKIVSLLREQGMEVEYPYMGIPTAFCAQMGNPDAPKVAILVEYDALPDVGHACGHNVHGSMAVLTGMALWQMRDTLPGCVRIIGTPAEEKDGAKIPMADAGIFDDCDLAIMIHSFNSGKSFVNMPLLALDGYDFIFEGAGAHAALSPWEGRNALTAARKFLDLVDARRQMFKPDVRCNGFFLDGGTATNVIAEKAVVRIEWRSESRKDCDEIARSIIACGKGAAIAFDVNMSYKKYLSSFAELKRNAVLEREIANIFMGLGILVTPMEEAQMASSDIGNVSFRCPTLHPLLAITEKPYPLHSREFTTEIFSPMAHERIVLGAKAMGEMTARVLFNTALRQEIRSIFSE